MASGRIRSPRYSEGCNEGGKADWAVESGDCAIPFETVDSDHSTDNPNADNPNADNPNGSVRMIEEGF